MLSNKQRQILAFPYTKYSALICDGAIRSGKTALMVLAFVDDAMRRYSGQRFAICGKTVDSTTKNVIAPYIAMTYAQERYRINWRRAEKQLIISDGRHENIFEVFGGKDEASFMLIQGRTLAGVLLDEVALMPKSFVEQALARCSVAGSRFWFNCNPAGPTHWFYLEWILKKKDRNALYLHFELEDNPSLDKEVIRRYHAMYSGVFFDRYIRGQWVSADGIIYDGFDRAKHVVPADMLPETVGAYFVSSDFGIQNATVFLLWQRMRDCDTWVCLREYYYSGRDKKRQKTVSELADGLTEMLAGIVPERVIVDPSAAALIVELKRRGYRTKEADNAVMDGISDVSTLLGADRLLFSSLCRNTIEEFGLYCWDERAANRGEDKPVKEHDHAMDAVRYFVRTRKLVRRSDAKPYQSILERM